MTSSAMISFIALAIPTLAQLGPKLPQKLGTYKSALPSVAMKGGAFAPAYMPAMMPTVEVAQKQGSKAPSMYDSRAPSRTYYAPPAPAPSAGMSTAGFSPEQLAFMQRQNELRGGAPSPNSYAPAPSPSYASPSYSYASSVTGAKKGYLPAYAPAYAPNMFSEPPDMALDATETSPNVVSVLAAGLIGAVVGAAAVTFVMRRRQSASTKLKERLVEA